MFVLHMFWYDTGPICQHE